MTRSIGLLGFGTIGREIARAIADGTVDGDLVAVLDHHPEEAAAALAELFGEGSVETVDAPAALAADADLVVEAAEAAAVAANAVDVLEAGCDLMLLSVGALADASLADGVTAAAERNDATVHVPSGAIAGLDAV